MKKKNQPLSHLDLVVAVGLSTGWRWHSSRRESELSAYDAQSEGVSIFVLRKCSIQGSDFDKSLVNRNDPAERGADVLELN